MRQVICIQVGGAGNRIGLAAWEQLLREHEDCLFPDKFSDEEKKRRFNLHDENDHDYRSVFREREDGKFVPITLFIDLERPILMLSELSDSTGENLLKIIQDYERTSRLESESLFASINEVESSCCTYASERRRQLHNRIFEFFTLFRK